MQMKWLLENWKRFLTESGLSRVHQHTMEHETAILTAFRGNPEDASGCGTPQPQDADFERLARDKYRTTPNNKLYNSWLKSYLLKKGYGVTAVDGNYVENYDDDEKPNIEWPEASYFVVNLEDDPGFFDTVSLLGQLFCQDSILLVPKGGKKAFLKGTSDNFEYGGIGAVRVLGDFKGGREAQAHSKIRNRPFIYEEASSDAYLLETFYKQASGTRRQKNTLWGFDLVAKEIQELLDKHLKIG